MKKDILTTVERNRVESLKIVGQVEDKKVQGKENLYQLLREDSQFRQDLEHQIQQKIKAIRIWKEEIPEDLEETQKEE